MEESKSSEVIFKYYLPDNQDELWLHTHAFDMYSVLHDIDQHCRSVIKYEEHPEETREDLAQQIRDMIHKEINMDMVR